MYAREYVEAYKTFVEFGKIKDIDFQNELWNEEICEKVTIRGIDFFDNTITLGTLIEYPCGWACCGTYWETKAYDLDRLAIKGYLGKLIDMMDNVLSNKLNQ